MTLTGLSHTGCTLAHKGRKATTDTFVVKMLRDAGAILLCVTNTPEMCGGLDCYNFLHGRSYNPYDTRYTPGGSSGGEAALLGAGGSLIGIAADFSGSIRVPGLFCGIFGFKPTSQVIPSRDHFPTHNNEYFQKYVAFGPMTRYADDLSLFMKVISMKSNRDLRLEEPVDWKQMKVYYRHNLGKSLSILSLSSEFKQCILKATIHFVERGVHTEEIPIEWPALLFEMTVMQFMHMEELDVLIDAKNPKLRKNPIVEMIKAIFGQSHHTMSLLYVASVNHVCHRIYSGKEMLRYYSQRFKEFQQKLQKLLGKNGVLIYPTFRNTAPFPELAFGELANLVLYSSLVNVLGFPAVQIPMGLNSKGMPMGLQGNKKVKYVPGSTEIQDEYA
ncbi:PREDICTED: fatty-acid amide hydrolase 2-like [Dinoponera quadriceps]|uniref:Fatty-acid amide hydrolase 2-like n=1 Tax=Dinoponera quadriceps TaxID=609295 RepID=A0A6P3Y709_DINQU|nr:PREDICTED: fatty-acid amide hydrolase 2-like [Dinoponera quadriceps]